MYVSLRLESCPRTISSIQSNDWRYALLSSASFSIDDGASDTPSSQSPGSDELLLTTAAITTCIVAAGARKITDTVTLSRRKNSV